MLRTFISKMRRVALMSVLLLLLSTRVIAQQSPEGVVASFLDAWNEQDYERMYDQIYIHRINGQPEYPQPVFTQRYESVAIALTLTGLTYNIESTEIQGQTAAVSYNAVLQTETFGEIADRGRTMRLINDAGIWKVAWSTLDIFDGLTRDGEIRVQAQPSTRATIYDRNGLPIAQDNGTTVGVYSARSRMFTEAQCVDLLGELLYQPIADIRTRFLDFVPETVFFLGEMPLETFNANRIRLRDTCGVSDESVFTSLPHRTYYGGPALATVTGYVAQVTAEQEATFGAGTIIGQVGVEAAFNNVLSGQQERVVRIIDPGGTILKELASVGGTPPAPIMLTIDRDLQLITANAMNDAFNYADTNWGGPGIATGAAAAVLDPQTGEILALVSYPMYNPSLFNPNSATPDRGAALGQLIGDTRSPLSNRATGEQYSPGSVFKIITMAAVLNEGVTGIDENYFCDLFWEGQEFGDTLEQRQDWRVVDEMEAAGDVTPSQALMASCNPWFWEHSAILFRQAGGGKLTEYSQRMGLAQTYEMNGALRQAVGTVPQAQTADAAISEAVGQGSVAIPPYQMAIATASIANGGTVYKPFLVKQVGGFDGTPVQRQFETEVVNTLDFNPGVLEAIQEGMCGVTTVEDLGTAYGRFISSRSEFSYTDVTAPYFVCGKTGTSQTARYPNAWFVAYAAPTAADPPEIAIVVMVEQSLEGSQVAAPIARRILDDYFGTQRASFPEWWNTDPYVPLDVPEGGGAG